MSKKQLIPVGTVSARLTCIGPAPDKSFGCGAVHVRSFFRCTCGRIIVLSNTRFRTGYTKSCGCLSREMTIARSTTHGQTVGGPTRTYQRWVGMINRCYNPNTLGFEYWGGRGITIYQPWRNSFAVFLADMGECPEGMEIDRWPNQNGNYEPDNCRWATNLQQNRNKRNNRIMTVRGVTACFAELCEHFGVRRLAVFKRLKRGWTIERAFFEPLRGH